MGLLFEREFRTDEADEEIYATSREERLIPEDAFIDRAYHTICQRQAEIDECIGKHAHGWKPSRLSKLSRSILRLAVYEMLFEESIPYSVTINEAVELSKKYDEDKARVFINGVLNSVKNEQEKQISACSDGQEG